MVRSSSFGKLSDVPVYRIRQVMQFLCSSGYVFVTDDQYPVVKLTQKAAGIFGQTPVVMKAVKEQEARIKKSGKDSQKKQAVLQDTDYGLFEELRN